MLNTLIIEFAYFMREYNYKKEVKFWKSNFENLNDMDKIAARYRDVKWAWRYLSSPSYWQFIQHCVQADIKANTKSPCCYDRWISLTTEY